MTFSSRNNTKIETKNKQQHLHHFYLLHTYTYPHTLQSLLAHSAPTRLPSSRNIARGRNKSSHLDRRLSLSPSYPPVPLERFSRADRKFLLARSRVQVTFNLNLACAGSISRTYTGRKVIKWYLPGGYERPSSRRRGAKAFAGAAAACSPLNCKRQREPRACIWTCVCVRVDVCGEREGEEWPPLVGRLMLERGVDSWQWWYELLESF